MQRFPVKSSAFAAIGFDPMTQTLEIEYHPNKFGAAAVWQYSPVDEQTASKIVDPNESAGKVFFAEVKSSPSVTAIQVGTTDTPTTGKPVNVKDEASVVAVTESVEPTTPVDPPAPAPTTTTEPAATTDDAYANIAGKLMQNGDDESLSDGGYQNEEEDEESGDGEGLPNESEDAASTTEL